MEFFMNPDLSYLRNLELKDRSETIGKILRTAFDHGWKNYYTSFGQGYAQGDETEAKKQAQQWVEEKLSDILALSLDFDPGYVYYEVLWSMGEKSSTFNRYWKLFSEKGLDIPPESKILPRIWGKILEEGQEHEIKHLVSKGLMPNWRGSDYFGYESVEKTDNFLWFIQRQKNVVALRHIPDHAIQQVMHETNSKGETALHRAARFVLPEYIKRLLALGADPKVTTKSGKTPMDMIRRTKSRNAALDEVVELLGGQSTQDPHDLLVQACQSLSVSMATLALSKGADLEKSLKEKNLLTLVFGQVSDGSLKAIRKLQVPFVNWMLQQKVDWTDSDGNTLLHHAIRNGATDVVAHLFEPAADFIGKTNNKGKLPHQVLTEQYEKVFEKVFIYGPERVRHFDSLTQKRMFQIYKKHSIALKDGSFPNLQNDPELQAALNQYILKQSTQAASSTLRKSPRL